MKARTRPMRGLKRLRCAQVVCSGHALYNPRRIQASLGGVSPDEYEDAYHRAQRDPHR